ncbi:MAG TPA: DUF4190 domain-containing protein [Polyangiaceae bacterium]|jgi:hypothetical protein
MYPQQPPPPGYPPYPPPAMPQAIFTPPPQNDGKAIASLVLGILSIVMCFGPLAGIPGAILGFMSKRDIGRSGGTLGGDGMALGGIITGILGTVLVGGFWIFYIAIFAAVAASAPSSYTPPPYTPYTAYTYTAPVPTVTAPPAPTELKPMPYTGAVTVVDLRTGGGSLRTQIALELGSAKDDGNKLLVITASRKCTACDEVFSAFASYDLQKALYNVRVVRVDVDAFPSELAGLGLDKPLQPWFYKFDDSMKMVDSISADEWDDNNAWNIAPVLKAFMAGTYKKRAGTADAGAKPKIQLSDPF